MHFANPVALWLLLLLPLLLWRRALPPQRIAVGALHLWKAAAPVQDAAARRWARIDALLLLRAALVTALVMALAGPRFQIPGRRIAIVVDSSASMGARDAGGVRLNAARQRVRGILDGLPWLSRVELISARAIAEVLGEFGAGDPALRTALDELRPALSDADLDAAVRHAAAGGADHTFVVTDAPPPSRVDERLTWITVGRPADNVAVTQLAYARGDERPDEVQLLMSVSNFGQVPATREWSLSPAQGAAAQGAVAVAQDFALRGRVEIPPDERRTIVRLAANIAGPITATIDAHDALASDDSRSMTIAPRAARRVRLDRPGPFVERAVRVLTGIVIVDDRPDIIVCGQCDEVPPGDAAVLLLPPPASAPSAAAPLVRTSATHAVGTSLALDGLTAVPVPRPSSGDSTTIALVDDIPAIVVSEAGNRRIVELRLDPSRGTLPMNPAFPILIANAIDWLAPAADPRAGAGVPASESDLRATGSAPSLGAPPATAAAADATRIVLAAALLFAATEWWLRTRRRSRAAGWRSAATLSRAAIVTLLVAGVAGVTIPGGIAPVSAFVVFDRSSSMGSAGPALDRIGQLEANRREQDRMGVIAFGATASIERRLRAEATSLALISRIEPAATNIENALRLARTSLPAGGAKRIVLVSDGQQTAGDALREAQRAAADDVRIDVALPGWLAASRRGPTVTRVTAPPLVRGGEPFEVTAFVEGTPGGRGSLELQRDGSATLPVDVTIPAGGVAAVRYVERQATSGAYTYRARVSMPADDFIDDTGDATGAGAVVIVSGAPRLLHVGGAPAGWEGMLARAGFRLETLAPASLPQTASVLTAYDAVVLDDVAGDRLDATQSRAIAEFVEQLGGGVLMLGTPRMLEPGFGGNDALTALSPVDFRPRGGQRVPGAALVIAFDKSGSMADLVDGAPKIEYARRAVERVLDTVSDADLVGVIAFDSTATAVVPLAAGHTASAVQERLRATTASGSTAISPALDLARSWLRGPAAAGVARRRILLVSDGRTSPADAAQALAAAAEQGIEISVVAPDAAGDRGFLQTLTSRSGGRAFFPADIRELPTLLAREASRVAGGRVVEEAFAIRIAPHPVTSGLGDAGLPTLGGYVVGALTPRAEPALVSHLGDPILATARRGLGRVATYTADLPSAWSLGLRQWSGFPTLLTQTVRWVSRRTAGGLHTTIQTTDSGIDVSVESDVVVSGNADARVTVRRPGGAGVETFALDPVAPGRYAGHVPAATPGPYLLVVTAGSGTTEADVMRGVYWSPARELSSPGVNLSLLTAIARASGGRVLGENETPFGGQRQRVWRPAAAWLAAAALAIFVAELLLPAAAGLIRRLRSMRRGLVPLSGDAV
jgi:Mg-chelatase subunit ChlD